MFTCAHCGAALQSARQACAQCNKESSLVLPTLQGFGEDLLDDGVKTLLSPRSAEDLRGGNRTTKALESEADHFSATSTLISPIPSIPRQDTESDGFIDHMSFTSDSETEVLHGRGVPSSFPYQGNDSDSDSVEHTISEEDQLTVEQIKVNPTPGEGHSFTQKSEIKAATTPPPIPPPSQSLGGAHLKGLENPFKPVKPTARIQSHIGLWLSPNGPHIKVRLTPDGALVNPHNSRKSGTIHFMRESFSFDERFGAEIWRPLRERGLLRPSLTLRSANVIVRLVEMTIAETEVISQIAVGVWQLKPSQEQVFYGAFNLFSGLTRLGGGQCEISLPFVQTPAPLFTLECDNNGDVWCLPNGGQEVWSLVLPEESLDYGCVLATQGRLFTVMQTNTP